MELEQVFRGGLLYSQLLQNPIFHYQLTHYTALFSAYRCCLKPNSPETLPCIFMYSFKGQFTIVEMAISSSTLKYLKPTDFTKNVKRQKKNPFAANFKGRLLRLMVIWLDKSSEVYIQANSTVRASNDKWPFNMSCMTANWQPDIEHDYSLESCTMLSTSLYCRWEVENRTGLHSMKQTFLFHPSL